MKPASIQTEGPRALVILLGVGLVGASMTAAAANDTGLLGCWRADAGLLQGRTLKAVQGGPDGRVAAGVEWVTGPGALVFDGKRAVVHLADRPDETPLPRQALTAEAWVRIDRPQAWGGIAGMLQDNGDYERGWLLGYVNRQFAIALASEGRGRLTYLKSRRTFASGTWHHVAGTYDGRVLRLYVDGVLDAQSTEQSGPILYPPQAPYVIGAYQDDNEFYGLQGRIHEVRVYDRALGADTIAEQFAALKDAFPAPAPEVVPFRALAGPFVDWVGPARIAVSWTTREPQPSVLEFTDAPDRHRRLEDPTPTRQHRLELDNIPRDTVCRFRLVGRNDAGSEWSSKTYAFDSTFNYDLPPLPDRPSPYPNDAWRRLCAEVSVRALKRLGSDQGWCLVLGARDGCLAYELARRSRLNVVVIEPDAARVNKIRRLLDGAGVYGIRVSAIRSEPGALPAGKYCANLIVSERMLAGELPPVEASEVFRTLRPNGGLLFLGHAAKPARPDAGDLRTWFTAGGMQDVQVAAADGLWATYRRPALEGAGSWSHLYGGTDNSTCSKDDLVRGDLGVLWWGRPGPRPMPDRGPRNPSALTANGRMYVQGDRILFGMDAYNGAILWSTQAPEVRRANMPRDCSNMAAADDYLYVASGSTVTGIEGQRGARDLRFETPANPDGSHDDWGYLGVVGNTLVGSAVTPGSAYIGDDGEWYDGDSAEEVSVVTSKALFAMDRHDGKPKWTYRGGTVINSTITIADGQVFFVESRSPEAQNAPSGRQLREPFQDQHLVALELATGRRLWEQKVDFSAAERMLYLSYGKDTLIAVGGADDGYHVWAYDVPQKPISADAPARTVIGDTKRWEQHWPVARKDHGGYIQHPLIVGDKLYCERRAFELRTGKQVRNDVPARRGCGIMAASNHSFFYRDHFHGQWDPVTNERREFQGIRGGCWLSVIPGEGLLLGPESSAGCSCTHAIQTSVAFAPRKP